MHDVPNLIAQSVFFRVSGDWISKPQVIQSSPNSSDGCGVTTLPFPHIIASAGQYLSQPQQMRSGCAGWIGNLLTAAVIQASSRRPDKWSGVDEADVVMVRFQHRGQF